MFLITYLDPYSQKLKTLATMTTMPADGYYWLQMSSPSHTSTELLLSWFLRSLYCWLKWTFYLASEWKPNMCSESFNIPAQNVTRDSWGRQSINVVHPFYALSGCSLGKEVPSSAAHQHDLAHGRSLKVRFQRSAAPNRQTKHCEEGHSAGAFLSSLTDVNIYPGFPS